MTTRVEPPQLAILLADNERLRALAASVIHDFNNFAAAIGGYSELVLQRLASDDEHVRAGVRGIRDTATWGARITRRLMAAAGRWRLPPTRLAVDMALTAAEPALRLLVGDGTRLTVNRHSAAAIVELPPGEFEQMLVNLVVTAREAVGAGGIISIVADTALAAGDGEEALRIAASHHGALDLIIVDVVMPGIGGEALAQRLTAGRPGTRVLYISGYTDDLIRQHGFTLASGHFLQKPFSVDDLARKVREVLRGRVA